MTVPAAAKPRSIPALRVVQGSARRRPRAVLWVLFSATAVAVFFSLIGARTSLDRTAFELQEIDTRIEVEENRFEELKLEVARLSSPARIEPLAESMGMVLPDQVTQATTEGVVGFETDREQRWAEMKTILAASP